MAALCLLMAVRRLSLPEAYLELQVARRRSFFVYQSDLGVLRRVEARLAGERGAGVGVGGATGGAGGRVGGGGGRSVLGWTGFAHHGSGTPATSGSASASGGRDQGHPYRRPAANSVSSTNAPAGLLPQARMVVPSQGHLVRSRPRASTSPWLPSLFADHQMWFNDPRFDGSFPSRVLPFLYLGNLYVLSDSFFGRVGFPVRSDVVLEYFSMVAVWVGSLYDTNAGPFVETMRRMRTCSMHLGLHTLSPLASVR